MLFYGLCLKLPEICVFAESAHSVKTKCVQIDFGGGVEIYDTISAELSGLELGVLGIIATCCYAYIRSGC